jgi:ubiquinone biosynthesis protein
MLKTRDIGRYRDLLVLFTRYGRKDFKLSMNADDLLMPEEAAGEVEPDVQQRAKAFATALKKMGATYVKFGQVLSTRPDIVPAEYIVELESLQDNVEPFSFADVERTVEEELGIRISKAFADFDSTPLAAASLGQVHRATLRDGRDVVVKVQRPDVREQVRKDLEVFVDIAQTLEQHTELGRKMNLVSAIEQARITLLNELNYVQEARNTEILRENLKGFPQIHVPTVVHDFSSGRVLTTELVKGRKVSKLTPLSLIENDYAELAGVVTRAYLKQICVDGVWHSDPHPGNVFVREGEDGKPQVVLLDFGMVSRISHEFQDEIIKLLLAISSNRGLEVAECCMRICEIEERFEVTKFVREISTLVATYHDVDINQVNVGQLIFNVISTANNNELKSPPELAMLAKTLLHLDSITKKLDPHYDPQKVIREYSEELIGEKLKQKFAPRNFYPTLLDLNQLILDLPRRSREILDMAAGGKLSVGIKVTQAEEFLGGMHKIANRITVGVVIAALLIASVMMMRVPSRFSILGYPGLAVVAFLIALGAACFVMYSILVQDPRDQEKAKLKAK